MTSGNWGNNNGEKKEAANRTEMMEKKNVLCARLIPGLGAENAGT
jgi:hypothetical protein